MASVATSYGYPSDLDSYEAPGSEDGEYDFDIESDGLTNRLTRNLSALTLNDTSRRGVPDWNSTIRTRVQVSAKANSTRRQRLAPAVANQALWSAPIAVSGQHSRRVLTRTPSSSAAKMISAFSLLAANASQQDLRRGQILPPQICVACKRKVCDDGLVTCSTYCLEKLSKDGGDSIKCDYCHRQPRLHGKKQCSNCYQRAKTACLLCKSRPKNGKYIFCGRTCKRLAARQAPFILEVPQGHVEFEMVEKKYEASWKDPNTSAPPIKRVFKVIEADSLSQQYTAYLKATSNEQYRYHSTKGDCGLGVSSTAFCSSVSCPACNICKTSFKVSFAGPNGAFGKAIYTTSGAHRANTFGGPKKVLFVTKVVLGRSHRVAKFREVMACPPGANSVTFDNIKGNVNWNETVVYSDDAIRPVFLITF